MTIRPEILSLTMSCNVLPYWGGALPRTRCAGEPAPPVARHQRGRGGSHPEKRSADYAPVRGPRRQGDLLCIREQKVCVLWWAEWATVHFPIFMRLSNSCGVSAQVRPSRGTGVMFLNEVCLGREYTIQQDNPRLTCPPARYDSVVARGRMEPGMWSRLALATHKAENEICTPNWSHSHWDEGRVQKSEL